MDIRVLRYFLAVAREGNITRAAESLHITQPSLSKQLMDLEQELGKTLLLRGKRKITLTEDGILLRKRADEIVTLLEKTECEISSDTSILSGEIAVGGSPTEQILRAAASIRAKHPDVQFHFYSSDATDVTELLDHGSLDFAVLLEPVDTLKYEHITLSDASRWGLLMPENCPLAEKKAVSKSDLQSVPLIFHRRMGLQRMISLWAGIDVEHLHVAATYNVIHGDPTSFVTSGLGYFLTIEDLLSPGLDRRVCFRPLFPSLTTRHALIWKRYPAFTKAASAFLEAVKDCIV